MMYHKPTQTPTRRILWLLIAGLLIVAAFGAFRSFQLRMPGFDQTAIRIDGPPTETALLPSPQPVVTTAAPATATPQPEATSEPTPPSEVLAPPNDPPQFAHNGEIGIADGMMPEGTTVFDNDLPAIANLDPALLNALRQAANDAAENDVVFNVTSGWRSPDYQNQLLQEAIVNYGSEAEAARWVASPETSTHVAGLAVDIGPYKALDWLIQHGDNFGLCQIYNNEVWHYEYRPEAIESGCPEMYLDPTYDPRMQP
ncbi:M15 family metallopeptidase [Herpetosiphon llansteffanensis]